MAVKKIMDTFFASMQEQTMAGYGGKLVNTPMGPFRWNDTMQLWENVNNGMVMNNISFQDSIMMLDYASYDGGMPTVSGGDPSLILYLNFAANSIGSMTYARGGTASYIDSDKFVKFVVPNTPRFSYLPSGTDNGLLIEERSINYISQGNCFGVSPWTPRNSNFTAVDTKPEYGLAPDNLTEPWLIMPRGETQSYTQHGLQITPGVGLDGSTYTFSFWAKGFGITYNRYVGVYLDNNNNNAATFDLDGLTSDNFGYASPSYGPAFSKITAYPNGWRRVEMTGVISFPGMACVIVPLPYYNIWYVGDGFTGGTGNTSGILVWGAQFELNSSASSYIQTTGATALRGNDYAYFSGTGFTSWFGASQGTFLIEFDRKERGHTADNVKVKTVMATNWNQGTCAGFALDYSSIVTTPSLRFRDSTPSTFTVITAGVLPGINKVAFSYNLTGSTYDISANLNGLCTGTGSVASSRINLAGASYMTFGYKDTELGATAFDYLNTIIRSVKYWNVVKTPAELQQLSS
jgi:hypothetical protein